MTEQALMTIKQASQYLFQSTEINDVRRTRRLIDKYKLEKITDGKTVYVRGQDLVSALKIKPPSNEKTLKAIIKTLLDDNQEEELRAQHTRNHPIHYLKDLKSRT